MYQKLFEIGMKNVSKKLTSCLTQLSLYRIPVPILLLYHGSLPENRFQEFEYISFLAFE